MYVCMYIFCYTGKTDRYSFFVEKGGMDGCGGGGGSGLQGQKAYPQISGVR